MGLQPCCPVYIDIDTQYIVIFLIWSKCFYLKNSREMYLLSIKYRSP